VKLLLDTHSFLWFISGDERLPAATRDLIRAPEQDVRLSVASVWEIVVKHQIGRLPLPADAWSYVTAQRDRHGIDPLPLEEASLAHLPKLPALHRDPFDRILICQAIEHDLLLVTDDELMRQYPMKTVWLAARERPSR
jgi:PIN domain nuclease of toxin-antitoxin system